MEFAEGASAQSALAYAGKEIDGRTIKVDLATPRAPRDNAAAGGRTFGAGNAEPNATLFVGNLSFDTIEDSVWDTFANYGAINGVRMPTDRETGKPKGFGYVEFGSIEDATKAHAAGAAGELEIDGRALRVDYSTPRPPRDESGGFGGRYVFHSPALLTAQWWSRGWSRRLWRPRRTRARIVRRRSRRTGSRQLRSRARPGLGLRGTRPWGSARQPAQLGRHPGRRRQQEDLRLAWLARRVACSLSFPRTCATSSSVLHAFYTV